jgi:transposase
MKTKDIIGIDVSKKKIDAWLHFTGIHHVFNNNNKGFDQMLKWVEKAVGASIKQYVFCFEHTGLYSLPLCYYLSKRNALYYLVSGLRVKRSLGLVRGKNDKIDAQNLAKFAYQQREDLIPYQLPDDKIIKLKQLYSFRSRLVKQRSGYKAHIRELRQVLGYTKDDSLLQISMNMIKTLDANVRVIENEMLSIIKSCDALWTTFKNITTIKGVGLVVAVALIAYTNNFVAFTQWRKFACYAGIAPFDHSSGTSYRGKTRISNLGNREMKTLLSRSAATSIQHSPEMKQYYQRRVSEGKSKMSTLNIIRNKILSRIFAVATRQSPYIDIYKFAA